MTQRELLEHSLAELRLQVEKHSCLMRKAFDGRALDDSECMWGECRHQHILFSLLVETVQTLDETRKAFKSKQLEQLRKRLLDVLTQEANNQLIHQELQLHSK